MQCSNFPSFSLVNGNWGSWTAWGSCKVTCGTGSKSRSRVCDNPAPEHGGADCVGDEEEQEGCILEPCAGRITNELYWKDIHSLYWGLIIFCTFKQLLVEGVDYLLVHFFQLKLRQT